MKENFNIEDLEHKNIYTTPKYFYKKIQDNVLRETSLEIEKNNISKVRKNNFRWWAVAASVLLMISVGLMWNEFKPELPNGTHFAKNETNVESQQKIEASEKALVENVEKTLNVKEQLAKNSSSEIKKSVMLKSILNTPKKMIEPQNMPLEKPISEEKNLIAVTQNETKEISNIVDEIETTENLLSEEWTDEDLAMVTQNMENDIYLELFN